MGAPDSGEIWSNTVRFVPAQAGNAPNAQALQTVADNVSAPLAAWMARADSLIGYDAYLTYVKSTWVGTNGKQRDQATAIHEWPGAGIVGGHALHVIWEQSYCITLRSALKRGRGHAGRIYPPLSGNPPAGVTAYCAQQDANSMAHSFGLCLTQMATAVSNIIEPGGPTGGFAVVSPGNSVKGTLPLYQYISTVVVDRVADIMHSRTNRVPRLEGTSTPVPTNV